MALNNKKSLLVLVLLIVVAALLYAMSAMNSKAPEMPAVEETPMEMAEESHADDHSHDHGHDHTHDGVAAASVNVASSVLEGLKPSNPLDVNPALGIRAMGNPDAPVKVTEVFSLTCNHCATFHNETYPSVKRDFIDTGKVYYVYQEFPLNAPALHASMVARCLPEERYAGFIDILFKTQEKWVSAPDYKAALAQTAKLAGMTDEDYQACMENKGIQQAFAGMIQQASSKWEIRSTPSIVINDGEKVIAGAQKYAPLQAALNAFVERAQSQESAPEAAAPEATPSMEEETTTENGLSFVAPEMEMVEEVEENIIDEAVEKTEEAVEETTENISDRIDNAIDAAKDAAMKAAEEAENKE